MNKYTLYYINGCPGARAVRLYMKHKNIDAEEVLINFSKGDHKTDAFLKLNPMHTVPTLKIEHPDGTVEGVYESRIILKHLENNTNIEVDKWLFWDLGFLSPNVGKIIYPRIFRQEEPDLKDLPNLIEKFDYLNSTLSDRRFLLNDEFTIADLSSAMLVENSQVCSDLLNVNDYPNVVMWLNNIKTEIGERKWDEVMSEFNNTMKHK